MKKALGIIAAIIRYILWIAIIVVLAVVLVQRISNNTKAIAGIRIFTIVTPSMVPEYNVGETIVTKTVDPAELQVGDDITYLGQEGSFDGKYITHRIINIRKDRTGNYIFQTKGIANTEPDPEINESQVYGRIIYKTFLISKLNSLTGNLYSMYFVIVVPIAIMMFFEIRAFRKDDDDEDDEEEKDSNKENEKDKDEKKENIEDKDEKRLRRRREKRKQRRDKRRKNKKE